MVERILQDARIATLLVEQLTNSLAKVADGAKIVVNVNIIIVSQNGTIESKQVQLSETGHWRSEVALEKYDHLTNEEIISVFEANGYRQTLTASALKIGVPTLRWLAKKRGLNIFKE